MKKYYGNYLGIVIGSGDDPENRNRIQVWIPHITNTLYDGWNNNPNIGNIDFFNFLQGNNTPNKELQDRIRNVLPWAECASPLFGGGSPVTQNLSNGQSSINSANTLGESSRTSIFDDLTDPLLPVEGDDGGLNIAPEPPEPENEEIEQGSSVASEDSGTVSDIAANNAKGSADGLPPVEPELPSGDYYPTPATGNFPSSNVTGETPTKTPSIKAPVVNFDNLYRTARSTTRGNCIDDGSTGLCLKAVSVWSYVLTKDEYFLGDTKTNANAINTGRSEYFQDSKLYDDRKPLPNNYVPVVGDIVSDKNHIITYLGNDRNGNQLWYSDFKDRSPSYYVENKGWNNPQLIRLNSDGQNLVGANPDLALSESYFDAVNQYQEDSPPQNESSLIEQDSLATSTFASPVDGGYDGTSSGTYSVPDVGSKVWVFFHGGDIQKPIYFAQSLDPVSFDQTTQGT